MWRSGAVSIHGSSHIKAEKENQDVALVARIGNAQLAIVCDGAGSAPKSAEGATVLSQEIKKSLQALPSEIIENPQPNIDQLDEAVHSAIERVRARIERGELEQQRRRKFWRVIPDLISSVIKIPKEEVLEAPLPDLDDYSSTLLACFVSDDQAWFCHIGDGSIHGFCIGEEISQYTDCQSDAPDAVAEVESTVDQISEPSMVPEEVPNKTLVAARVFSSLPENGEYANETYFFTHDSWRDHFRSGSIRDEFNFMIIFTDGADPFLLERNQENFVVNHAIKLWEVAHNNPEMNIDELLERFFTPEKVHALSTDDTTIGLLVR